jgi:hypothetical protein
MAKQRMIDEEPTDAPVWFTILWDSMKREDFVRAGEAKEQLRRLGVEVSFTKLRLLPSAGGKR